jgi:hypothetical protein
MPTIELAFSSEKAPKTGVFGNFVIQNHPIFIKIGNFVSKNIGFYPFLDLAKNLTIAGRR